MQVTCDTAGADRKINFGMRHGYFRYNPLVPGRTGGIDAGGAGHDIKRLLAYLAGKPAVQVRLVLR